MKRAPGETTRTVALLEDLKRLAILQLISSGVQATHVAQALGVDKSVVSRMIPARSLKKKGK